MKLKTMRKEYCMAAFQSRQIGRDMSRYSDIVSRTRCGILHAAPQSRDRTKRRRSVRPRLCSAPLREELRAALRPGHAASSCAGLTRASIHLRKILSKGWIAGSSPAMTEIRDPQYSL